MKRIVLIFKRRLPLIISVLFFISFSICLIFIINNFNKNSSIKNVFSETVSQKGESIMLSNNETSNTDIVAKGDNISITKGELDLYADMAMLSNPPNKNDVYKDELQYLIKRSVLFNEAEKNGYLTSDDEVSEYIKESKNIIDNSENYNEFSDFVHNLDMTEEEYWDNQYEQAKIDLTISDYLNLLKEKLAKENNLEFYPIYVKVDVDSSENNSSDYERLEKLWSDYYNNIVEKLIEKENIEVYLP